MPRVLRRIATATAATATALGLALVAAPAAQAEPSAVPPTRETCGWTTCTKYWSVARTKEFNAEDKAKQQGQYVAGAVASGVLAVYAAPAGIATGAFFAEKGLEFEQQISGAANDGRCLIYKYPRTRDELGWWGSVNPGTNKDCIKANNEDPNFK